MYKKKDPVTRLCTSDVDNIWVRGRNLCDDLMGKMSFGEFVVFHFLGKDARLKIKDKTLEKTMMMFTLKDSKPGEPLLLHEEPIYLEDKIIGRTTSGNYSFCFDKNLSFGYVNSGNTIDTLKDKNLFIEIEKIKYPIEILSKPLNTKDFRRA